MLAEIFLPQKKGIKTTAKSPFKKRQIKVKITNLIQLRLL
jgi:hypothetical protein